MKHAKYLLLTLLLAAACSNDKTENDPVVKAQIGALLSTDVTGLYRNGEPLLLFDKTEHLLVCTPSKNAFRIQDDAGAQYVNLRLDAMPEQGQQVRGTESDNMGFDIGALDDIRLLHTDGQKFWLWSDKARMGFIFPKIGF
mgnify:FL=1